MTFDKGSSEKQAGVALLKEALGSKRELYKDTINDAAFNLYGKIVASAKGTEAIKQVSVLAESAQDFASEKLEYLALKIDPSLVVNGEKGKKISSNDERQTVGGDNNSKQPNNSLNQPNSTKQAPEKSNKEDFLDLNKAKERILPIDKLSTLWVGQNKIIEGYEAVDNVQAAALVYVHNGLNAGDTINHPLSPAGEIKLATVFAVELLQSMKLNNPEQLADLSAKLTNNSISGKVGIDGMIADMTKSIKDSGVMDMVNGTTSFMKVFNGIEPILEKANTMMDLLREGSSNFDAKNMSISQLHQLCQSCNNRSFPSTDQIIAITKQTQTDEQWYTGKLKSLTIPPAALTFIKEHLTELPFLDIEGTKKTQELAKSVEEGMDSVYKMVGNWFGVDKGPEIMDRWIESLMQCFNSPFVGALANMAGIDLSKIKQTLSGEFTPAQEEQFEQVVSKYSDMSNADGNWVTRLGGWISDTTSERYKALEKFNMKYFSDHLGSVTPHVSVVQSLVGNDETLKAKYLTTKSVTKDGVATEQVVIKEGVLDNADNKKELAGLFCANDAMIKSVIDSTKWTTSQDVAGLLAAHWIKGANIFVRSWTKYQEKQAKINPTEEQKKQQEDEQKTVDELPAETAIAGSTKVRGGITKLWLKDQTVKLTSLPTNTKMGFAQVSTLGYLPYSKKPSEFMKAFDIISQNKQWSKDERANVMLGFGMLKRGENRSKGNFNTPYADGPKQTAVGPWAFSRTVPGADLNEKGSNLKQLFYKDFFLPAVEKYKLEESLIAKESQEYYAIGMLTQFETRKGNFGGDELGAIDSFKQISPSMTKEEMKRIYGSNVQGAQSGHSGTTLYANLQRPLSDFVEFSNV